MSADKREKFLRISEKRVNGVLEKLEILSRCANKQHYDYDDLLVKRMFKAIEDEVRRVKGLFAQSGQGGKEAFRWEQ